MQAILNQSAGTRCGKGAHAPKDAWDFMIEAVIIRRAETEWNAAGLYLGRTDVPVGQTGMEELQKAVVHPEVRRVFASPMLRTRQTAKALFRTPSWCC